MPVVENAMKKKLEAGGLAIAMNIVMMRLVSTGAIAKECGYDWIFVDMEHSTMDLDTASQICLAALPTGVTPIARVPSHDGFHAARILDGGAMGVVAPHVNTAEQAAAIVGNCKYPPVGHRSLFGPLPQLGFEVLPSAKATAILNENTLVIVMLETPEAVANAEAIAAVPGVDALLMGSNDLAAEIGIPGQFSHEKIEAAYATMTAACRKHGKFAGMGGIYDHGLMEKYIGMGVRFVLGGGDTALLMAAAKERAAFLRSIDIS